MENSNKGSDEKAYCCGVKTLKGTACFITEIPWILVVLWVCLSPIVTILASLAYYAGLLTIEFDKGNSPLPAIIAIIAIVGDVIFVFIASSGIKKNYDKDSNNWYSRIIKWIIVSIGRLALILKRCN
jgi:hypothetical protein